MDNNNTRFTSRLTHYDRSRFEVINWICKSFRCEIRELSLGYSVDEQFLKELIMERHKNNLRTKFDKVIVTTPVEKELIPFIDFQSARLNGSMGNTSIVIFSDSSIELKKKRLEIQRNKYHAMTPEQTKEYNAKRTELGRKRRWEEDEILHMVKKGNVSAELLAREKIIKEKWNAERAKLRYDSMTNSEKKKHNKGRTRTRTTGSQDLFMELYDESPNDYSMPGPSDTYTASFFDDDDESLSGDEL
ncbi:hypothetical protein CAEBREN_19792 [Caenorhabditis brenneri]|uniref:Uncharacterized protein n=1 Tax=Caenorhabditis brenneri TaxID=135651 RepID=G0NST2_CAEBE|nr:hypothetical protein CAEBREN_19792 [Caenorhabditis brenneri]